MDDELKILKLHRLFGDGMVLQRNCECKIHGRSTPKSADKLSFLDCTSTTYADDTGLFSFGFNVPNVRALGCSEERHDRLNSASASDTESCILPGPYEMTVESGNERLVIKNILIGEVWFCSGQSNMELPIGRVKNLYPAELGACNPKIRQFLVSCRYDFAPQSKEPADYPDGQWDSVAPETISRFYAVPYFFAKELYSKHKIPIGLINCAAGGSTIEAWMSEEIISAFPERLAELRFCQNRGEGYPDTSLSGNGSFWFRTTFELPQSSSAMPAVLRLGCIRDADNAYINGVFVGSTGYQYPPREYRLPPGLLHAGTNSIAVNVLSLRETGGFVKDKPYRLEVGGLSFNLDREWAFQVGVVSAPAPPHIGLERHPFALFNAMASLPSAIRSAASSGIRANPTRIAPMAT